MSEQQFYPGQPVLVRENARADYSGDFWTYSFFSFYAKENTNYPYKCLCDNWRYCIPYNDETSHLLGTADALTPPEPKFKFGDKVRVWDDNTSEKYNAIYVEYFPNENKQHCVLRKSYLALYSSWNHCELYDWSAEDEQKA